MNETPGEQRRLDLFKEEALLSAVQQLWRGSRWLCSPTAAAALCNSPVAGVKSQTRHRTREWTRAEWAESDNVSLYSLHIIISSLPHGYSRYEYYSFSSIAMIWIFKDNKSVNKTFILTYRKQDLFQRENIRFYIFEKLSQLHACCIKIHTDSGEIWNIKISCVQFVGWLFLPPLKTLSSYNFLIYKSQKITEAS